MRRPNLSLPVLSSMWCNYKQMRLTGALIGLRATNALILHGIYFVQQLTCLRVIVNLRPGNIFNRIFETQNPGKGAKNYAQIRAK